MSWWENKKSAETKNQVMGEPERWANAKDGFHEEAPADTSDPSTLGWWLDQTGHGDQGWGSGPAQDRERQETPRCKAAKRAVSSAKAKQEISLRHKRRWQRHMPDLSLAWGQKRWPISSRRHNYKLAPIKACDPNSHTQTKSGRKRNSTRSWADGAHNQQPVKLQTHSRRQIQATHKEFPQVKLPRDWVHCQKSHIHTKAEKQSTTYKNQWKHRQKN